MTTPVDNEGNAGKTYSKPKGVTLYAENGYPITISETEYTQRLARGRRIRATWALKQIVSLVVVLLFLTFVCLTFLLLFGWRP